MRGNSNATANLYSLPGGDSVTKGSIDGHNGKLTVEALLVAVGAPRLQRAGVEVPEILQDFDNPNQKLYFALEKTEPDTHQAYNSLVRLLVSFEENLERLKHRHSG